MGVKDATSPSRTTVATVPKPPSAHRAGAARPGAAVTPITSAPAITLGVALLTWMVGWFMGNVLGSLVLAGSGKAKVPSAERPVWLVAGMAIALWLPQIAALAVASRRFSAGNLAIDFSLRFKSIDLVGIPVGVLSQLLLLRLVYWPLEAVWPHTFGSKQLEQNARDLYDTAHGTWLLVLVLIIVVGAPFVEELVYRGLLMGAARRRLHDVVALVGVAVFFALIHFRPVEYPGLFVFGLVLGGCVLVTDRIGMSIVAHMAFNATALALVAR